MKRKIQFALLYIFVAATFWFVGYEQRFRVVSTDAEFIVLQGSNLKVTLYANAAPLQGFVVIGSHDEITSTPCQTYAPATPKPKMHREIITLVVQK